MVIVKLMGGLGNQMFQYALGRHLSKKNNATLYIDTTNLLKKEPGSTNTVRDLELDIFDFPINIYRQDNRSGIFYKIYDRISPIKNIQDSVFRFNPAILQLKGNLYLDGYWQTEEYFKEVEELIRKDFIFKNGPNSKNAALLKKTKETQSVSVHFRRGDYITNKGAQQFHGLCSPDYYKSAMKKIKQELGNPHYFIFSDEVGWVRENFSFDDPFTIVEGNTGKNSFEDMRLMAACKHNIIANSSFSWWGAWLNEHKNKIVIAPTFWFKDVSIDTSDVIPDQWIKI
jgi:hypothetical protein